MSRLMRASTTWRTSALLRESTWLFRFTFNVCAFEANVLYLHDKRNEIRYINTKNLYIKISIYIYFTWISNISFYINCVKENSYILCIFWFIREPLDCLSREPCTHGTLNSPFNCPSYLALSLAILVMNTPGLDLAILDSACLAVLQQSATK